MHSGWQELLLTLVLSAHWLSLRAECIFQWQVASAGVYGDQVLASGLSAAPVCSAGGIRWRGVSAWLDLLHALTQEPPLSLMVRLFSQKGLSQPQNLLFLLSSHLQAVLYTKWVALTCFASATRYSQTCLLCQAKW